MNRQLLVLATVGIVALTGCDRLQPQSKVAANSILDTRAFIEQGNACPAGPAAVAQPPPSPALESVIGTAAAAIAVPLIEAGVKQAVAALSNAIEEAAKDKEKTIAATAAANDVSSAGCVIIVRGVFGDGERSAMAPQRSGFYQKIGLVGDPELYAELTVVPNGQPASAFRLELAAFDYRKPLQSGMAQTRDLVISMVFQSPAKKSEKDDSAAFGVGALSLDDVAPGSVLTREGALRGGKTTAWIGIPATAAAKPARGRNTSTFTATEAGVGPYAVFASVTETREGSKFMKFLSGVIKPNEETISTEGAKIVIDLVGLKKE
jgi:hypothetical protein